MSSVYTRNPTPLAANVDGEIVMLEPSTSRYFGLADTAVRIWQLLEVPSSVADVVDALLEEYDVDRETCTSEVLAFISELEVAGLIVRSSGAS
jgi:hypothetical protein